MDRIDRLRRKALQGVKDRETRAHIIEAAKEVEEYFKMRKATPMTCEEEKEMRELIAEFDVLYS